MSELRTAIVIDYQNVHLTGHGAFMRRWPKHECLIDPLNFANNLIGVRNGRQRPGHPAAVLERVDVFRGLPSPDHEEKAYGRNLAQRAHWLRDPRVTVTHRPLRYRYLRDGFGRKVIDPETGLGLVDGPPQEKGVDVLCALALVRHARNEAFDLVVLASLDSDLIPALDEAHDLCRVETFSWWTGRKGFEMQPSDRSHRIWNTRMNEKDFHRCLGHSDYS